MAKPSPLKLCAESLETLGAPKLAALLMDFAESDKTVTRALRLALAGTQGGGRLKAELDKRMRAVARSRASLDWDKVRPLADELDSLRKMIAGALAETDIRAAVAQMRAFIGLAGGVFDRCDDSNGTLDSVFEDAGADLGRLWGLLPVAERSGLAKDLMALLQADEYMILTRLLASAYPALDTKARATLRKLLEQQLAAETAGKPPPGAAYHRSWIATSERLMELADLDGDVPAFIAAAQSSQQPERYATEIAQRLILAGQFAEALTWLGLAPAEYAQERAVSTELRFAALDALGRKSEAQELRWASFCELLNAAHLRAYLRGLPDGEAAEAENHAIAHALAFKDQVSALAFLVEWPDLVSANILVKTHHETLPGRDYKRLRPAAEALAMQYPGAATLLHRRLVEDVLDRSSSAQYQYVARDFRTCRALAASLPDDIETHEAFVVRLRQKHSRKVAFWGLIRG